jgi:hypothetical protein
MTIARVLFAQIANTPGSIAQGSIAQVTIAQVTIALN